MLLSLKDCRIGTVALNLIVFRLFTHFPTFLAFPPLIALLSGVIALVLIFIIFKLAERLPDGSIVTYKGTFPGIIVTFIAVFFVALNLIYATHQAGRLIKQISFPTSPLWYISLFLVGGALVGAFSKRAFSRLHNLFVPGIATVILLMIASTLIGERIIIPSPFRTENLYFSIFNIFKGILMYADVFLLLLLPIQKTDRKKLTKTVVLSSALGLFFNCAFVFAFAVRIPNYLVNSGEFPMFLLMKEVCMGRFFQRIDTLVLMACAYSAMLYGCFNLFILTNTIAGRIKLFGRRLLLTVCAAAVFAVTILN